jgi:hypothetical protein
MTLIDLEEKRKAERSVAFYKAVNPMLGSRRRR